MSEEIITMLSNLGAIEEGKAVALDFLKSSEYLKDRISGDDIVQLVKSGYVDQIDGKLFLTRIGLLRALSNFS